MNKNIKVVRVQDSNDNILSSTKKIKELLDRKKTTKNKKKIEKQKKITENSEKKPSIDKQYKSKKRTNLVKKKKLTSSEINIKFTKIINRKIINSSNKKDLLKIFQKVLLNNNINLTNKFIKFINKKQIILILSFLNIINNNTKAPLPLLKNLLYNYLTSNIKIIK